MKRKYVLFYPPSQRFKIAKKYKKQYLNYWEANIYNVEHILLTEKEVSKLLENPYFIKDGLLEDSLLKIPVDPKTVTFESIKEAISEMTLLAEII